MKHKHNYKQTGTVMVGTGKYWVYGVGSVGSDNETQPSTEEPTYHYKMPITNLDTGVTEIKEECLVFICDGCGDVLVKKLSQLKGVKE